MVPQWAQETRATVLSTEQQEELNRAKVRRERVCV
jgi:hypothetical protein